MRAKGFDIPPEFEAQYETELNQICKDGGFDAAAMDSFAQGVRILAKYRQILIGATLLTFGSYMPRKSRSVFPKDRRRHEKLML